SARPFASIAEWGLPVNGRPYPKGTALEPGPGARDGGTTGSASSPRSQRGDVSRPTRPAPGVVDPARCRHPCERTQGKPPSGPAGGSGPPWSGSLAAQAAGSSVAGSSRPQALIPRRQRLTDQRRLSPRVILSRPAPQPAPGDSAVALPTTTA